MENKYTPDGEQEARGKLRLKLAHLPTKAPARLRLGGMEPSEDMQPGEHRVTCEGASKKQWAKGIRIELKYRVIDGPHAGTALRQSINVDTSGVISPKSRYATQCAIALGRALDPEDDINNPAAIFVGPIFRAFVGFRKTEKARGGKDSLDNALHRKDSSDGLRVHELLRRDEL